MIWFLGVVGVIDGVHVKINSPGGADPELFRNRKGFFSINVQGICDSDLNFTNIVAKWYGSAHDSRIFESSSIYDKLNDKLAPGIIIGDSGYPCTEFCLTLLPNPVSSKEKRFNSSFNTTRNFIERTFGIWKRKFPCLLHLRTKLNTSLIIIVATAVLHNITRRRNDHIQVEFATEYPTEESDGNQSRECNVGGRALRQKIISEHF